jgi:IclR family acetate operon transcriptional repressor
MSATRRIMDVTELLARKGPLGMRAMARDLEIPAASLHRLLHELEREQVVERTDGGDWLLSYRLLHLAGTQLGRLRLPALARPYLERIALETRETTFLAIPSGEEIVYLDMVQTDMQLQLNVELGARRPMHCTGLGKAILAHLAPARQQRFLGRSDLQAFTPHTMTDPIMLARELERIRSTGYAIDREEIIPGVHCIAVPLLNHTGRAVGAISIAGTSTRAGDERHDALVALMREVGAEVSMRLGYVPIAEDSG